MWYEELGYAVEIARNSFIKAVTFLMRNGREDAVEIAASVW